MTEKTVLTVMMQKKNVKSTVGRHIELTVPGDTVSKKEVYFAF